MAALFERMEADCLEAFPELAEAAAEEKPDERRAIGPFPERGLYEDVCLLDLELIRGAAQFFAFWQGRGYAIAPDY